MLKEYGTEKVGKEGERNIFILHGDGLTHTCVEIPVIIGQNLKKKKPSHFQQGNIWIWFVEGISVQFA